MATLFRRRHSAILVVLFCTVVTALTGCAADSAEPTATDTAAATPGAFPVTITAAYGDITVEQKPERIVALNGGYLEFLDLLDEEPVAFGNYSQNEEEMLELLPWLEGRYTGEPDPNLATAEGVPSLEAIAAYEPDLILGRPWRIDEAMYEQLSAIAPTYIGLYPDGQTAWQDDLRSLALLTGHNADEIVNELSAQVDSALSAAAAKLPGLQGKTFVSGSYYQQTLTAGPQGAAEYTALGLVPFDGQPTDSTSFRDEDDLRYSRENIDQLTADVVFIATHAAVGNEIEELQADPRVAQLPASQNGTFILVPFGLSNAVNPTTPASLQLWLDGMVPMLEDSTLNRNAD